MKHALAVAIYTLLVAGCSEPAAADPTHIREAPEGEYQGNVTGDFADAPPRLTEAAPQFALPRVGGGMVRLSDATAEGPAVVVFASFT